MESSSNSIIEILCLNLKTGSRIAFNKLYQELSLPMLKRWKVEVLAFGPTMHEEDTYLVVRRYKDSADRQQSQDAFYGSDEWKQGPRETIMALIENYTSVVVPANETLIGGFKMMKLFEQAK